jgi:hypothetical protein
VEEISGSVSDALELDLPYSLIRLGDGEGLLLSISDDSPEADLEYLVGHLGGKGKDLESLLYLKNRLISSIRDADFIGVRDDIIDVKFEPANFSLPHVDFLEKFRMNFRLREFEKTLGYHGSRRIAFLHKGLGDLELNDNSQFCSAWIHYAYHNTGELFKLLEQQARVGIISCRT